MPTLTTHDLSPPFPPNLPCASLVSISLEALLSSDNLTEPAKAFDACRTLGFFYLDLRGSSLGESILSEAEQLHALQQEFYALPHSIKDEYGQDKVDPFFSYRWTPCHDGVEDVWGRPGRREMYNLRVDDILHIRPRLPRHAMISSAEPLLTSFAVHCREAVRVLLSALESQLDLPAGTLLALHREDTPRGDFISLQHRASEAYDELTATKGEHTDFGTITMLFNWLGGLQIREQTSATDGPGQWLYVKPVAGSCIVNIADSLARFSAGILRTNIHRVVPAPGAQAGLPRYSLVYFSHPNDDVQLAPVKEFEGTVPPGKDLPGGPVTAAEWVMRRSLGDLRGVYTYRDGIEWKDNSDAVAAAQHVRVKA